MAEFRTLLEILHFFDGRNYGLGLDESDFIELRELVFGENRYLCRRKGCFHPIRVLF